MGPPRPIWLLWKVSTLWSGQGGTWAVHLSSWTPYSPRPGKTNLAFCLLPPAFLEMGFFKGQSMYATLLSQTPRPFLEHRTVGHCFSEACCPTLAVCRGEVTQAERPADHSREGDQGTQWAQQALAFLLGRFQSLAAALGLS